MPTTMGNKLLDDRVLKTLQSSVNIAHIPGNGWLKEAIGNGRS